MGRTESGLRPVIGRGAFIQWDLNTRPALLHSDIKIGQWRRAEFAVGREGANESEGRLILRCQRADGPFPRCAVCLCYCISGQFKGKGNGGPEAPKLRSHFRAEILEQRVHCVWEKGNRNLQQLTMCYCLILGDHFNFNPKLSLFHGVSTSQVYLPTKCAYQK